MREPSYIGLIQGYSMQSSTQPWRVEYSTPYGRWASWRYCKNLADQLETKPHIRYCWKNFRAGHCRVAEEALPGKARFECQQIWVPSWSLSNWHGLEAEKAHCIAIKKSHFGTAVNFDIQNAFNSMPRMHIMDVLQNAKVPVNLHSIIQDYFQDPVVLAQTAWSMIRK